MDVGYTFDQALNGYIFAEWDMAVGLDPTDESSTGVTLDGHPVSVCLALRDDNGALVQPDASGGKHFFGSATCATPFEKTLDIVFDPEPGTAKIAAGPGTESDELCVDIARRDGRIRRATAGRWLLGDRRLCRRGNRDARSQTDLDRNHRYKGLSRRDSADRGECDVTDVAGALVAGQYDVTFGLQLDGRK